MNKTVELQKATIKLLEVKNQSLIEENEKLKEKIDSLKDYIHMQNTIDGARKSREDRIATYLTYKKEIS